MPSRAKANGACDVGEATWFGLTRAIFGLDGAVEYGRLSDLKRVSVECDVVEMLSDCLRENGGALEIDCGRHGHGLVHVHLQGHRCLVHGEVVVIFFSCQMSDMPGFLLRVLPNVRW